MLNQGEAGDSPLCTLRGALHTYHAVVLGSQAEAPPTSAGPHRHTGTSSAAETSPAQRQASGSPPDVPATQQQLAAPGPSPDPTPPGTATGGGAAGSNAALAHRRLHGRHQPEPASPTRAWQGSEAGTSQGPRSAQGRRHRGRNRQHTQPPAVLTRRAAAKRVREEAGGSTPWRASPLSRVQLLSRLSSASTPPASPYGMASGNSLSGITPPTAPCPFDNDRDVLRSCMDREEGNGANEQLISIRLGSCKWWGEPPQSQDTALPADASTPAAAPTTHASSQPDVLTSQLGTSCFRPRGMRMNVPEEVVKQLYTALNDTLGIHPSAPMQPGLGLQHSSTNFSARDARHCFVQCTCPSSKAFHASGPLAQALEPWLLHARYASVECLSRVLDGEEEEEEEARRSGQHRLSMLGRCLVCNSPAQGLQHGPSSLEQALVDVCPRLMHLHHKLYIQYLEQLMQDMDKEVQHMQGVLVPSENADMGQLQAAVAAAVAGLRQQAAAGSSSAIEVLDGSNHRSSSSSTAGFDAMPLVKQIECLILLLTRIKLIDSHLCYVHLLLGLSCMVLEMPSNNRESSGSRVDLQLTVPFGGAQGPPTILGVPVHVGPWPAHMAYRQAPLVPRPRADGQLRAQRRQRCPQEQGAEQAEEEDASDPLGMLEDERSEQEDAQGVAGCLEDELSDQGQSEGEHGSSDCEHPAQDEHSDEEPEVEQPGREAFGDRSANMECGQSEQEEDQEASRLDMDQAQLGDGEEDGSLQAEQPEQEGDKEAAPACLEDAAAGLSAAGRKHARHNMCRAEQSVLGAVVQADGSQHFDKPFHVRWSREGGGEAILLPREMDLRHDAQAWQLGKPVMRLHFADKKRASQVLDMFLPMVLVNGDTPFTLYSRAYWAWVPWAKLREQAGAEWVWMPEYSEWQSGARPYFMVARASTLTLIARSRKQQQQQQQAGTSWSADAGPSTAAPATAQGPADPQKDADAYWQSQLWELAPVCSGRWLSVEAVMHRRRAQIMRCTRLTPSKRAQLLQVLGEDHAEAEAQAEAEGAGAGTGADDAGAVGSGGTEPGTTFGTGGGPTGYQSAAERQEPQHMWGINGSGSGGGSDSGADDDGGGADDDSSSQLGRVAAGSSGSGDEDGAAVACVGSDDEGGLDGAHGQGSEGTGAGGRGPKHHTAFPIHPEPGGKRRKHQLAVRAAEQWLTHIHPYDNSAAAGAGSNPSR